MEEFRTVVKLKKTPFSLDYQNPILCMGSCFATHIAHKLSYHKFEVTQNPFGVIFHPLAIENLLNRVEEERCFCEDDFFFHNELWHCYELHSDLSHPNLETAVQNANSQLEIFKKSLQKSNTFILTLGTAWVYELLSGKVVANCHKMPQKHFTKRLLSVEEIKNSLHKINKLARKQNPNFRFVWTISPVRHIKDGFVENNRSKAHLITALHAFLEENATENQYYFPAYEMVMDELRDYRFYTSDMLHPSDVAVNYILQSFKNQFFTGETQQLCEEIEKIQKSLEHKPFHSQSQSHQTFVKKLEKRIAEIEKKYPYIRF